MDINKKTTSPFIFTKDKETSELLKLQGLNLIYSSNGNYIFVNSKKLQFTEEENKKYKDKLVYTNKMFL